MAREPFNRIWTETPTVDDFDEPTEAMWDEGWRGGADQDPPEAFAQNWWQNRVDFALRDIERKGAMLWLPNVPYAEKAIALGVDGDIYRARADNTGVDPTSDDGTTWKNLTSEFLNGVGGIIAADYFDTPVQVFLGTVGDSSANETSPFEGSIDGSLISGISSNARAFLVHIGMRSGNDFSGRAGVKKPSDAAYKWIVGTYDTAAPGEEEGPQFKISGGLSGNMWIQCEGGVCDFRAETDAANASVNIYVLAEII